MLSLPAVAGSKRGGAAGENKNQNRFAGRSSPPTGPSSPGSHPCDTCLKPVAREARYVRQSSPQCTHSRHVAVRPSTHETIMLDSQVAPAFPWGVTSSSAHFQWPEVALEQKAPSWGSVFHKSTTPAGHYRRTSQQIGALHTSTAPDSAFANMCRSPTMTRVRYLDAPSQPRNEHSSSIMKHASRSNYTMTPGEEELLREAELSYTSKMYGALLTSSEHASASSALASQSLNAFRSRQTATHTTNGVFHKSMPNAALGQQMVRLAPATSDEHPRNELARPHGMVERRAHVAHPHSPLAERLSIQPGRTPSRGVGRYWGYQPAVLSTFHPPCRRCVPSPTRSCSMRHSPTASGRSRCACRWPTQTSGAQRAIARGTGV